MSYKTKIKNTHIKYTKVGIALVVIVYPFSQTFGLDIVIHADKNQVAVEFTTKLLKRLIYKLCNWKESPEFILFNEFGLIRLYGRGKSSN